MTNNNENKTALNTVALNAINHYFDNMENPSLINFEKEPIVKSVESAVYEAIMRLSKGNQSKAAKILKVNRITLRSKLLLYFGTTLVGGRYHQPVNLK